MEFRLGFDETSLESNGLDSRGLFFQGKVRWFAFFSSRVLDMVANIRCAGVRSVVMGLDRDEIYVSDIELRVSFCRLVGIGIIFTGIRMKGRMQ